METIQPQETFTEEKESEMEEFIDYAKVIMGTLGHKLFEPVTKSVTAHQDDPVVQPDGTSKLYLKRSIKNVGTVAAMGSQTTEGFVVLEGSHISPVDDDTIPAVIKERRKKAPVDGEGNLTENLLFTSPSYAAMFVIGKSANGLTSWKNEDGHTLKSMEADEATE